MANKKDQSEEVIVDVQEVYSKTETFINENKNTLSTVVAVIAVIIGGYFAYNSFYLAPMQDEAQEQMFMAEKYFAKDSMNLAIHGDAQHLGFLEIADQYSGTKAGNLAYYYLGIAFLKTGQFEAAIDALEDFEGDETIVESIKYGAMGDAYMELGDYNKAVSNYEKAATVVKNDFSTPMYLLKAGQTYELLGDYDEAVDTYSKIKSDFRTSAEAADIEKYIARAESYVN
ncbi:MAG: tetratricopeptide repeat protein [Flavobacteriales bacterium]|nr:tetratricopeptide repeat protein [Flavobacteriales bacterium]|tara:strand:+ start:62 stop:748 length:687 start_codon:yes stop_codon:yes gene_type:complete